MQRVPPKPKGPDDWAPHTTPGFEINGRGQLRTVNHQPGPVKPAPRRPVVQDEQADDAWSSGEWLCNDWGVA